MTRYIESKILWLLQNLLIGLDVAQTFCLCNFPPKLFFGGSSVSQEQQFEGHFGLVAEGGKQGSQASTKRNLPIYDVVGGILTPCAYSC